MAARSLIFLVISGEFTYVDLSLHLVGLGARLAIYAIEAQAKDVMAKNSEKPEYGKPISHHCHMRLV